MMYQSTAFKLHNLFNSLEENLKTILKYYMQPNYVKSTTIGSINPGDNRHFLNIDKIYLGARVEALLTFILGDEIYQQDIKTFKLKCLAFYVEFCKQILKRVNFKDPVLQNLSLLNPQNCKSDETHSSIIPLALRFPNVIREADYEEIDREWRLLKSVDALKPNEELMGFWNTVFSMKNDVDEAMFPLLTKFVKAMFCLPHSSAATERVFSAINNNKNKLRNRLLTPTMNGLLLTKEKLKNSSAANFKISSELITLSQKASTKPK
jgi:hypothetical protein